ncbi:hypothetical protein LTR86_009349 [Recurvomyces mirabilis]|nr:hypothetical protein LTR86_009349 [Recurvomyces mirabilis]
MSFSSSGDRQGYKQWRNSYGAWRSLGYPDTNSRLLTVLANDRCNGAGLSGVAYSVVFDACTIIANNTSVGFLSLHLSSATAYQLAHRIAPSPGYVLPVGEYYFHVPLDDSDKPPHYTDLAKMAKNEA